jgi:glycosyltransferase involved in cell wall biosynthesis
MKIVILSDDFPPNSFGGAGIIASGQARELARRGHEVYFITTVRDPSLEKTTKENGVTIHYLYSEYSQRWRDYISLYNPQTVSKVKDIFKKIQPDVVHVHNIHIHLSYHVFFLAKLYSKAVFMTVHDSMSVHMGKIRPKMMLDAKGNRIFDYRVSNFKLFSEYKLRWNPFRSFFIKYYLKKANIIFSVSSALAETLRQNGIVGSVVMHNGIDAESFFADEQSVLNFKNKHGLNKKKVLFFGGRISRTKGGDVAMHILEELHKTIPDACLLVVGKEDVYVQNLRTTAIKKGMKDKIVFTGWLDREEIISAYYASNIVLTLSLYMDPFPTINLEAMSAKKPVVGTCYGGTPEAILDGVNGFIVDPDSFNDVFKAVLTLALDENLSKKLGEAGHSLVLKDFSLNDCVDDLERKYASIVSHG